MMEKVLCPYCGNEMKHIRVPMTNKKYLAYMVCSNNACHSIGPTVTDYKTSAEAEAAALAAAQARYLPPNRPLTLDEVAQLETDDCGDTPCWTEEFRNKGRALAEYKSTNPDELIGYGRDFRVWLRKPTQAEMDAAGWGEESHENA